MYKESKERRVNEVASFNTVFLEEEDGGFSVTVPALPGCVSQGDSFEEALNNIKEAIGLYVEGEEGVGRENSRREFMVPVEIHA